MKPFFVTILGSTLIGAGVVFVTLNTAPESHGLKESVYTPSTYVDVLPGHGVVTEWMGALLNLTTNTPGYTPPVAARALGYVGVGLYESARLSNPEAYMSLTGQLNEFDPTYLEEVHIPGATYNWDIVVNTYFATMARALYTKGPFGLPGYIDNLERHLETVINEQDEGVLLRSRTLGQTIAQKILTYAATDGQENAVGNNFPTSYTPPRGAGLWAPTPEAYQRALQPYWGEVRPFLSQNLGDDLLSPPPSFSLETESPFYTETMEVYDTVENLSEEERVIAKFWSDDPGRTSTPPGHSLSILKQVLEEEDATLLEAAEAFARLGIGVHDAFIACWKYKYAYNLVRPITVIRDHIDPTFTTPVNTPPFPEYPSGHSVQSGAAATILTSLFGENYAFEDTTHAGRSDIDGTPRSFASFDAFAEEAAVSRLYGGIHYRSAIENGLYQGNAIGENVNALVLKK